MSKINLTLPILMIVNGLFFISNIYVLGDTQAALAMHSDLPRSAGPVLANAKVLDCFIVGLLYLVAAYGLIRKQGRLALAGVVACVLFVGLYFYEFIAAWGNIHVEMWLGFGVFGGLSLLFGVYSGWHWRKSVEHTTPQAITPDTDQVVA